MDIGRESFYTPPEKITNKQIIDSVWETQGLKLSFLNIAQIKEKCGLIKRREHKPDKSRCTPAREAVIMDAFRHFGIIKDEEG